MKNSTSNPPDNLADGPQEAGEFIADVPSQPSRDISDLASDHQQSSSARRDQHDQQQAEAELKAALGSDKSNNRASNSTRAATKLTPQDSTTGTHS